MELKLSEQEIVRREKLDEIRKVCNPYPSKFERTHTLKEARELEDGTYSDARVLTLRELFIVSSLPEEWNVPDWASDAFVRQVIGEAIPPMLTYNIVKLIGSEQID